MVLVDAVVIGRFKVVFLIRATADDVPLNQEMIGGRKILTGCILSPRNLKELLDVVDLFGLFDGSACRRISTEAGPDDV